MILSNGFEDDPIEEVRERVRRRKASDVARYYYAHLNFMSTRPTRRVVGRRFGRSARWAGNYLGLARELRFIEG